MIKREIVKIDNLLTDNEMKEFESELLLLDSQLQEEHNYGIAGKNLSNYSRIYLDDLYEKNRSDSFILNVLTSKLFSDLIFSKLGRLEPFLRLIPFSNKHEIQYTVYEKGGEYKWHLDSTYPDNRIANFILYINDDFEGGELELSFENNIDIYHDDEQFNPPTHMVVVPKKNTLLIMPSDMWHKVKPITNGKRRTLNGHIGFGRS
tara:strand:+ start:22 stop:636 length:615 start_codon:yes stop_codon:yes gene_type:complete